MANNNSTFTSTLTTSTTSTFTPIKGERWRDIEGYEGRYRISDHGRVFSLLSNKLLSISTNNCGYKCVYLYAAGAGNYQNMKVHRLVAAAFIPNPSNLPQVNHKNEDKTDNHYSNLEWCSANYNNNYGTRNLRAAIANARPVVCIETGIIYWGAGEAARQVGIYNHISECCNGQRKSCGGYHWRWATETEISTIDYDAIISSN